MGKTIVFCADGTWNGPGDADPVSSNAIAQAEPADENGVAATRDVDPSWSNVYKLFRALAGDDDPASSRLECERTTQVDGAVVQVAKYLHGVGDSTNAIVHYVGGAVGAGLIARIVRGYTFVSRNYERGDAIVLVGFSRGAYTARALGGLITAKGLLDGNRYDLRDRDAAYLLGLRAWYAHRGAMLSHWTRQNWFTTLQRTLVDLPAQLLKVTTPPQLIPAVAVHAIAVWDTVGALGIPDYDKEEKRLDGFEFCDTRLHPAVDHGRHAVSLDERRVDFTPTLWQPADTRIRQVLFPGAHSDVGGGYPDCGLSSGALAWMMAELRSLGVRFATTELKHLPDPTATGHQPWLDASFVRFQRLVRPREFHGASGLLRHASIDTRKAAATVVLTPPGRAAGPYAPDNLPEVPLA
jgi:uncharacterized protein (DUF2235 family)